MEILSGMILLLQVVISIQIMLVGKQVLQGLGVLAKKIDAAKEQVENQQESDVAKFLREKYMEEHVIEDLQPEEMPYCDARKEEENLLNEVLSEVFS